jgi:hypothetical protein
MKNIKIVFVMAALVLLAACGTTGGTKSGAPSGKGKTVEQRALERWNFLIERKAAEAYEYLTPGYRSAHPKDVYAAKMSNRPVKWNKATIEATTCEDENTCVVALAIDISLRMGGGVGTVSSFNVQKEKWLRIKNQWYHLPDQ